MTPRREPLNSISAMPTPASTTFIRTNSIGSLTVAAASQLNTKAITGSMTGPMNERTLSAPRWFDIRLMPNTTGIIGCVTPSGSARITQIATLSAVRSAR